jgi:multiple sugar transport system permease protein
MSTSTAHEFGPIRIERQRLYNALTYVIMYGTAVLFMIPFWRMIVRSFTSMADISSEGVEWIPPAISFRVWEQYILQEPLIIEWLINTFIIATATTLLVVFIDSLIAFSITRLEWPGQRVIFGVIMASFMVPAFVNMIPLYQVVNELGLIDTLPAVILPFTALPLGVFLLVQFFRDIPVELEEAARLDGFSSIRIYTHIILPLARPILTALSLFIFVWSWNQFLWPLIVLQSDSNYTLAVGVVTVRNSHLIQVNLTMATMLVAAAPLFVVFLIFQDKLISAVQLQAGY